MNLTGALKTWILLLPMCSPAAAHWLPLAPEGILATKGGKPDLAAPAPRKPDDKPNLSKMWQADPRNTKLSLTVYVQASIGDSGLFPILSRAQSVASGMFATAGARINWRTGLAKASEPELPILIDITWNTPEEFHPGALAYAHPFEGVHIRVFYDRVKNAYRPHATAMLLAHVLVHEITHVLEGMDRHSEEGVMKAQWTADDLVQMVYKPLPFDPQDVLLIRKSLANRGRPARKAPLGLISPTVLSN
jgi:hypothetical protein